MIFGLVFISYELVNMGPGDNIAYKLGAAATKKNQELCYNRLESSVVNFLVLFISSVSFLIEF